MKIIQGKLKVFIYNSNILKDSRDVLISKHIKNRLILLMLNL